MGNGRDVYAEQNGSPRRLLCNRPCGDRGGNCTAEGKCWYEEVSPTLKSCGAHAVCYALDQQGGKGGATYLKEVCPTILSDSHGTPHAVAYGLISKGNGEVILSEEKHMSLTTGGDKPDRDIRVCSSRASTSTTRRSRGGIEDLE